MRRYPWHIGAWCYKKIFRVQAAFCCVALNTKWRIIMQFQKFAQFYLHETAQSSRYQSKTCRTASSIVR